MSIIYTRDDYIQPYSRQESNFLIKRKGGGGGGAKSGGSSSSSSSSSGSKGISGSSSSSGTGTSRGFIPGTASGGSRVAGSTTGRGISSPYSITSGAFAGRMAGGGTRTNAVSNGGGYGSGYTSGYTNRGGFGGPVGGLGFPFLFWPIAFGGFGYAGYYGSRELDDNADRPGGNMTQYTLTPPANVTNAAANNFALLGDMNSVDTIFQTLITDCGISSTLAANFSINPNETVAYYRGSSFALALDGYNNGQPNITDTSGNSTSVAQPLAPLPSTVDTNYFNCLNSSIGTNVPLVDATSDGALALNHAISLPAVLALPALLVAFLLGAL